MPQSYSIDFRKIAVQFVKNGEKIGAVSKKLKVDFNSVKRWLKMSENGSLEDQKPKKRKPKKLDPDVLKKYVDKNSDKTLQQIADHFGVWIQAVYYRLDQIGYTYKKRLSIQGKRRRKT